MGWSEETTLVLFNGIIESLWKKCDDNEEQNQETIPFASLLNIPTGRFLQVRSEPRSKVRQHRHLCMTTIRFPHLAK